MQSRIDAELGTYDDALAALSRGEVRARRTVESVAITNRNRGELELFRAHDELFGLRCPAQKRKRGAGEELDEMSHGY